MQTIQPIVGKFSSLQSMAAGVARLASAIADTVAPALDASMRVAAAANAALAPVKRYAVAAADAYRAAGGHAARKWGLHWNTRRPWVQFTTCATEEVPQLLHAPSAYWQRFAVMATARRRDAAPPPASAEQLTRSLATAPGAPNWAQAAQL